MQGCWVGCKLRREIRPTLKCWQHWHKIIQRFQLQVFKGFESVRFSRIHTFPYHALLKVGQSPVVTRFKQNFRVIKKMFSQIISQYVGLLLENIKIQIFKASLAKFKGCYFFLCTRGTNNLLKWSGLICLLAMFVTAVCFLFLLKLKWPKNKNIYDGAVLLNERSRHWGCEEKQAKGLMFASNQQKNKQITSSKILLLALPSGFVFSQPLYLVLHLPVERKPTVFKISVMIEFAPYVII